MTNQNITSKKAPLLKQEDTKHNQLLFCVYHFLFSISKQSNTSSFVLTNKEIKANLKANNISFNLFFNCLRALEKRNYLKILSRTKEHLRIHLKYAL